MRAMLSAKARAQADVCRRMDQGSGADQILALETALEDCNSASDLRLLESQAAAIYWKAWATHPLSFARRDEQRVPMEWRLFGSRVSPLTSSPRKAGTPGNAVLNYLYALLEAETRVAILTMGLDPGVGILHADQDARDSLVYDLMEPVRPQVDAWLHELLMSRRFSRSDFFETPEGQVELCKPLAHELTMTMPIWAKAVGPVVEWVASCLQPSGLPTRLTESNRSRRRLEFANRRTLQAARTSRAIPRSCPQCGDPLQGRSRFCSAECSKLYTGEVIKPTFEASGVAALRAMRASKQDPAHGGDAAKKRGRSNIRRTKERRAWSAANKGMSEDEERQWFRDEILPALAAVPVYQIAKVTSLSMRYASLIRSGARTPHPMHYPAFRRLINGWKERLG